jgi:hypothetical protein
MNSKSLTGARRVVVRELVGVRIDADDAEGLAAILADPSGQIWIDREGPTLIPHALLSLLVNYSAQLPNQSIKTVWGAWNLYVSVIIGFLFFLFSFYF